MSTIKGIATENWENFNKYMGVQGIMGLALVGGFIYASLAEVILPELYANMMTLVVGFYFAKNGVGILAAVSGFTKPKKG